MHLVFYISGHGFGHASRCLEVASAIAERRSDARVIVRTSVAPWFLERSSRASIDIQPAVVDTGMVQIDSLRLDEDETARQAGRFYDNFDRRVSAEAGLLRSIGASAVVGDIPPLAFAAAARAGLPATAIGNFTWDWIYSAYPRFEHLAPGVIDTIRASYAQATVALRLPLHGGFEPMLSVTRDIPFIARRSTRSKAEVRRLLGIDSRRPVALASFGAYGISMSVDEIARANDITLLVTDHEVARRQQRDDHVMVVSDLESRGLRYEDLVAATDFVVSKPGYGIVSECIANGAALLYTSRDRFVEYDVFVEGMPKYLRCCFLDQRDLLEGRWSGAIAALLDMRQPTVAADVTGAAVAADAILSASA